MKQLNIYDLQTGEIKPVKAHIVLLPYNLAGFATKQGKYWFVYEYASGVILQANQWCKTKAEAIEAAKDRLLFYGEETVKQLLSKRPVIN